MSSLPLYFPPDCSPQRALLCARLLAQAYEQAAQWRAQGAPRRPQDFHWQAPNWSGWRFSAPLWSILSGLPCIRESEPFGFAASNAEGESFLVLRGTDSALSWLDEVGKAQLPWPWGMTEGTLHGDALGLYVSVRDLALAALDSLQPNGPLCLCGHGLGGAISSLAAFDLRERWPDQPLEHYSFGSPRLASPAFAAAYAALQVPTFRLVNDSDRVAETPPAALEGRLYQHLGVPVCFTASYQGVEANHALVGCYQYALEHPAAPMRS